MGIVSWILMGLLMGFVANQIVAQKGGGLLLMLILGVIGAFVGGFIGSQLGWGTVSGFDIRSLLLALGGTVLVILGHRAIAK